MVRHFKPNLIVEVGSGYSSLLSAQAAEKNGNTEIICIEPYPSQELKKDLRHLKQLVTTRVQDMDPSFFEQLQAGDIFSSTLRT
jgi:predicted O-methyltransferase YrrM